MTVVLGCVIGGIVVVLVLLVVVFYLWRQRARARENTLKLTARMSGLEESEVSIRLLTRLAEFTVYYQLAKILECFAEHNL